MGCSNNNQGYGHGGCGGHGNHGNTGNTGNTEGCCVATTGCNPIEPGMRNVVVEPIYVQKVYDSALFHMQHLVNGMGVTLTPTPAIPTGAVITDVTAIRCRKYFDPTGANSDDNLVITPTTDLTGAEFVRETAGGDPVTVVGPDGLESQSIIYIDTNRCDKKGLGTSIFGTQSIAISGNLEIEIDVKIREACGRKCKTTLRGLINVSPAGAPALTMPNFFELCVPSTNSGAFFPRLAELCNLSCEPRLATNDAGRDLVVQPDGTVNANIITALCLSCEKKIIVPVQLCVLSTGFPDLQPFVNSVCKGYPSLFPNQIDEESIGGGGGGGCKPNKPNRPRYQGLSLSDDEIDNLDEI